MIHIKRMRPMSLLSVSAADVLTATLTIRADIPERKALILEVASRIESCLIYGAEKKLIAPSVAVVYERSALIRFQRQKRAQRFQRPSPPRTRRHEPYTSRCRSLMADGVPVLSGDAVFGAVGISSDQPERDAACAQRPTVALSGATDTAKEQRSELER